MTNLLELSSPLFGNWHFWLAYIYGTGQQSRYKAPKRIPVLLVLRQYRDLMNQEQPPTLPELITTHHIPKLAGAVEGVLPSRVGGFFQRSVIWDSSFLTEPRTEFPHGIKAVCRQWK